ncbi:hypothetical protein L7F22_010686 [Adiantum nelumboides]|nr:hypothetical protein [Adiantum nelumboides]
MAQARASNIDPFHYDDVLEDEEVQPPLAEPLVNYGAESSRAAEGRAIRQLVGALLLIGGPARSRRRLHFDPLQGSNRQRPTRIPNPIPMDQPPPNPKIKSAKFRGKSKEDAHCHVAQSETRWQASGYQGNEKPTDEMLVGYFLKGLRSGIKNVVASIDIAGGFNNLVQVASRVEKRLGMTKSSKREAKDLELGSESETSSSTELDTESSSDEEEKKKKKKKKDKIGDEVNKI